MIDGLSPNGKATDSDSVIVKVRILLAQLEKSRSIYALYRLIGFFGIRNIWKNAFTGR